MKNMVNLKNNNYLSFIDNKDKQKISGIYGIMIEDELVYIGQSKDIVKRCKQHSYKIIKSEENCKKYKSDFTPLYIEVRKAFYDNKHIKFVILERVFYESSLKYIESYYINKYSPRLNIHNW